MIWALVASACGMAFHEAVIDGLTLGERDPLTGQHTPGFLTADMNGDGANDLILPQEVRFQSAGTFPPDTRAPWPTQGFPVACDIWDGAIYLRSTGHLQIMRWNRQAWATELDQAIAWHSGTTDPGAGRPDALDSVEFVRFLHDVDGNGKPEIVLPDAAGLHVYALAENQYVHATHWPVFPAPRLALQTDQVLWPWEDRQFNVPAQHMFARFAIEGGLVTVVSRSAVPSGGARYRWAQYQVNADELTVGDSPSARGESTDLPADAEPIRLSGANGLGFAGADWDFAPGGLTPEPIYEAWASTDGGQTVQRLRARGIRPHAPFVDFNGDGRLDIVIERSGLFDGGIRETVSQFLTARRISHELHVHFQDGRGQFSRMPDIQHRFSINLNRAPVRGDASFQRYQSAERLVYTGDINGDGYKDAVLHVWPRTLQVYLGSAGQIANSPSVELALHDGERFMVHDVDGDGHSDIVCTTTEWTLGERHDFTRVLFARDAAP